ncbi:phage tail protein [Lentzea sp. NEAU-D7]|uniref:phage tail protein n=1 Tax=Lentzea sp. NEAU-D7 TaxID=2994667 RepID=UPI00224A78E4|nr:phage tail protein [Lentzea sp. NEAU-D7]MCX2954578.1 phage tail protein [Lentzea sp. NEAU-D7]
MALSTNATIGVVMRFRVVVDGIDLGGWSSCKGLNVGFETEEFKEGANYEYVVILPERLKYNSITLTRAMTSVDSAKVQAWLRKIVADWYSSETDVEYNGGTAQITLLDARSATAHPVASWSLRGVFPKSWKGPDLDATGNQFAIETLELVHHGFL